MEKKPLVIVVTKSASYHSAVLTGFLMEQKALYQEDLVDVKTVIIDDIDFVAVGKKVQEVIAAQPTIVVTIGGLCSQAVVHAFAAQKIATPIVFCGVVNSSALGFDYLMAQSALNISGISLGHPSYKTLARVLLWFKPHVQSVLLPYNCLGGDGILTNAAHLIKEFLESKGVVVVLLPLGSQIDVVATIESKIQKADVLLSLEGCLVDDYYREILALCQPRGVTYFTGSLDAVRAGAALGMVTNPELVGITAFRRILHMISYPTLKIKGMPTLLKNEGRRVAINVAAAPQQGIQLSEEKLYFLKFLKIVGHFCHLIDSEESV